MTAIVAAVLGACATANAPKVAVTAEGLCQALGRDLAGAKGAAARDQEKIDVTLERMIAQGCITRAEAAGI